MSDITDVIPEKRSVPKKGDMLTAQEIVNRFGITYQTLCHYTNLELLHVAGRHTNKRLYSEMEVARRLAWIKELRIKNYSLKSIRNELDS